MAESHEMDPLVGFDHNVRGNYLCASTCVRVYVWIYMFMYVYVWVFSQFITCRRQTREMSFLSNGLFGGLKRNQILYMMNNHNNFLF